MELRAQNALLNIYYTMANATNSVSKPNILLLAPAKLVHKLSPIAKNAIKTAKSVTSAWLDSLNIKTSAKAALIILTIVYSVIKKEKFAQIAQ